MAGEPKPDRRRPGDRRLARGTRRSAPDALVAEAIANNLDLRQAAERSIAQQRNRHRGRVEAAAADRCGSRRQGHVRRRHRYPAYGLRDRFLELYVRGRCVPARRRLEAGSEATALDYAFARQSLAATVAKTGTWRSRAGNSSRWPRRVSRSSVSFSKWWHEPRAAGTDSDLDVADTRAEL